MKVKRNYFDTHTYKIERNKKGKYQVYIRSNWLPIWRTLNVVVKKMPITSKEQSNLEDKWFEKNGSFNMESYMTEEHGWSSPEFAKKALNCFVHTITFIVEKQDFKDAGSLKEFAVLENI